MAKTITLSPMELVWVVQSLEDSIFQIKTKEKDNWENCILTEAEVRSLINELNK